MKKKEIILISLISLAAISIFSYFSSPTVFSGRDQGSLSEAAIRLAQNHQLKFTTPASEEFFKIYGSGKALNFPGFYYTESGELTTQFPLGYISWLAIFYSVFGLSGLVAANAVSFFIFLLSFYLLSRQFLNFSSSLVSLFFILSSFIFSWFFKFTLSENLALALVWFGIYQFVLFIKSEKKFSLPFSLISFGLLLFVRIEAAAFLAMLAAILYWRNKNWKKIFSYFDRKAIYILSAIALLFLLNIFLSLPFYLSLAKAILKPFTAPESNLASAGFAGSLFYVLKIFGAYSLFGFLILGLAGIFYFLKKKNYLILIPFFILLPSFFYLFSPNISADHPWMLRRFLFAVVPACIFYTVLFLDKTFSRRLYFYTLSEILIAANLFVTIFYLPSVPHRNLLAQIEELSHNFQNGDLILVDREASGDGWSMMSGPLNFLYGKQAAYFFNPQDLEKIDKSKFANIYLIIPDHNFESYAKSELGGKLQPVKDYSTENNFLESATLEKSQAHSSPANLPMEKNIATEGKIYLYLK